MTNERHTGVNLACEECKGAVEVTISEEYVKVMCTQCGSGDRYPRFVAGTTLYGGTK